MLKSIKQLCGNQLGASDGEIGCVKDFYVEDQTWTIRYLIVDTGSWLPGRQVLISPYSLHRLDQSANMLRVNLTRKQIEDTPIPVINGPRAKGAGPQLHRVQAIDGYQLRSSRRMIGHVCDFMMDTRSWAITRLLVKTGRRLSGEEEFSLVGGQWCSFKTGHRLTGKEELIPAKKVDRISYKESTVFVDLTREGARQSLAAQPAPVGVAN